jgi:hypothetical protein
MDNEADKLLLVGDNPFHNISHLSQEKARARNEDPSDPEYAAGLIITAMENGANGFLFSVSETTLAILDELRERNSVDHLGLYAIVPYAFDYVRLATQVGGISGLGKRFVGDIIKSRNVESIRYGLKGVLTANPEAILKTYLAYELSRIRSYSSKKPVVQSLMLHQLITDMALALNLEWLFKAYVEFLLKKGITPGFNTGNFAFLVKRLREWEVNLDRLLIVAPFNNVGFQMVPSKEACEKALNMLSEPNSIAISVLAAGYVSPLDAAQYISSLPNIKGVAIGVSKEKHAKETFSLFKNMLH